MTRLAPTTALTIIVASAALMAHHSLAGVYDSSRTVTIRAVVSEFHFVNPHPYLVATVSGTSDEPTPQRWRLELDNRSELAAIGMTTATFQPGDGIVVSGSPGRTQPRALYVRALDRPTDKFHYEQVGSSPVIRR
jgi:hypothetical protein